MLGVTILCGCVAALSGRSILATSHTGLAGAGAAGSVGVLVILAVL